MVTADYAVRVNRLHVERKRNCRASHTTMTRVTRILRGETFSLINLRIIINQSRARISVASRRPLPHVNKNGVCEYMGLMTVDYKSSFDGKPEREWRSPHYARIGRQLGNF